MKVIYAILATVGWAWLVIAGVGVWLRIRQVDRRKSRALETVREHEA